MPNPAGSQRALKEEQAVTCWMLEGLEAFLYFPVWLQKGDLSHVKQVSSVHCYAVAWPVLRGPRSVAFVFIPVLNLLCSQVDEKGLLYGASPLNLQIPCFNNWILLLVFSSL